MMSTMITYEVALQRLQGAVEAKGADYRPAEGCRYFDADGQPLCIVGVAFEPELRAAGIDDAGLGNGNVCSVSHLTCFGVLSLTPKALAFLDLAQSKQDTGAPWGFVVQESANIIGDSTYSDTP